MQRRIFLKSLFKALSALSLLALGKKPATAAASSNREILLQSSLVAGFQFYEGKRLWNSLRPNDTLQLVAEPENPHDDQAVKVMWNDSQLGYVPRHDNTAISQMLHRGQILIARIGEMQESAYPWARVTMDIFWCSNRQIDAVDKQIKTGVY